MRSTLVNTGLFTLTWLALSIQATTTPETCDPKLECCVSTTVTRRLRRTDTCPIKKCCAENKHVLTGKSEPVLQCGKSSERTSTVTASVDNCPSKTDEKCLRVYFNTVAGQTYKEVHLQLDDAPVTITAPGQFQFNSYCKVINSGANAECWVPMSAILPLYALSTVDKLCDAGDLWIATHAAISDGNTCWGRGPGIEGKANNWAMNFPLDWKCSGECVKECCCPETKPPTHNCEYGTAFGYNPMFKPTEPAGCKPGTKKPCKWTLNELGCGRWGWHAAVSHSQIEQGYTVPLYVGAGQNDISKGTVVGTASLNYNGGVKITYDMDGPYQVDVPHVYISCSKIPHDNKACAPGQYTINPGCLTGVSRSLWTATWGDKCDTYHVIFHAAVTKVEDAGVPCTKDASCRADPGENES